MSVGTVAGEVEDFAAGCLYATTVGEGGNQIRACSDSDPLNLAKNADVQRAMRAYGIPPNLVRFKGCEKQPFAAYPDASSAGRTYVVAYASEQKAAFLAPVLHELAHVMQMEAAGGLVQLRKEYKTSKRIELGADYLAGVMFAKHFPSAELRQFEQNLLVMGLYYEQNDRAHGTPAERNIAFRFGAFLPPDGIDSDLRKVSAEFQRNRYGEVISIAR